MATELRNVKFSFVVDLALAASAVTASTAPADSTRGAVASGLFVAGITFAFVKSTSQSLLFRLKVAEKLGIFCHV